MNHILNFMIFRPYASGENWTGLFNHLRLCICRMKVNGELPNLSLNMSDVRLKEILDLVQSIPFPEGAPPPPEDQFLDVSTYLNIYYKTKNEPRIIYNVKQETV